MCRSVCLLQSTLPQKLFSKWSMPRPRSSWLLCLFQKKQKTTDWKLNQVVLTWFNFILCLSGVWLDGSNAQQMRRGLDSRWIDVRQSAGGIATAACKQKTNLFVATAIWVKLFFVQLSSSVLCLFLHFTVGCATGEFEHTSSGPQRAKFHTASEECLSQECHSTDSFTVWKHSVGCLPDQTHFMQFEAIAHAHWQRLAHTKEI